MSSLRLLNTVRPEQLLSRKHYVMIREKQAKAPCTKAQREKRRSVWDSTYAQISREAWLTVLLQAVRVFSLTRITPKTFASLPGVLLPKNSSSTKTGKSKKREDSEFAGSNVYSVGECILLKWLAYHISNGSNQNAPTSIVRQLQSFDEAFTDGIGLCHILLSHSPSLGDRGGPLDGCKASVAKKKITLAGIDPNEALRVENAGRAARSLGVLRSDLHAEADSHGPLGKPVELLSMNGVRAMLYALHLYLTLPNFVPKTTIEYNATLGEPMCKMIELQNSAPREISYEVVMEGSSDFRPKSQGSQLVVVNAKSSSAYGIEFVPKFSKPVEARLTFFAIPGNYPGLRTPSMVFTLRSSIENAVPLQVVEVKTTAYEHRPLSVDVKNPFGEANGDFSISLNNVVVEKYELQSTTKLAATTRSRGGARGISQQQQLAATTKKTARSSASGGRGVISARSAICTPTAATEILGIDQSCGESDDERMAIALLNEPFWTSQTEINLEVGKASALPIQLLPMSPGVFKAELRFLNDEMGEFALEIIATVSLPKQIDNFKFSIETSDDSQLTVSKILRLPTTNPLLDRALTILCERLTVQSRQGVRAVLQGFSRNEVVGGGERKLASFEFHANSPYFKVAEESAVDLSLCDAKGASKIKKVELVDMDETQPQSGLNSTLVQFFPQKAGIYQCLMVCRGNLAGGLLQDIRAIAIEATTTTPKVQTLLEFTAPARRSITQDLPVVNMSEEDWLLNVQLSGSRVFSGPSKLRVPAVGRASYPLTFAPTWIGKEIQGKLVFRRTNDILFEYSLSGEGEAPLAEGNEIIRCNARDTVMRKLRVTNSCKEPTTYAVVSDLDFVSGDNELTVPPSSSADYELFVTPSLGGSYAGSVYFNASKEYMWYTVKIEVDSPREESVIDISTVVRQAASVRLSIENPLNERVVFDVELQGDGLLGEDKFILEASEQSGTYELFYTPLIANEHQGSVAFLNDKVGEFWYRLNLCATKAEPLHLDTMVCAVGARVSTDIPVENPLDHEITLVSRCSNSVNYSVEPEVFNIPPYGSKKAKIFYSPSDIDVLQTSDISLHHAELGDWEYTVSGKGIEPGLMNEHVPIAVVGEPTSYMISFRNPFVTRLEIDVVLRESDPKNAADNRPLALLMRRTERVPLAPRGALSIPMSFDPTVIAEHHAIVEISASYAERRLTWTFPIRGVVNAPLQARAVSIRGAAKTSTRRNFELELAPDTGDNEDDKVDFELSIPDADATTIAQQALTIIPIDMSTRFLKLQAVFEPAKPFHASAHLVIKRRTGGRWPFEIMMEALPPKPDDIIQIQSKLHNTSTVTFRLKNNTMEYAPFTALFTTESPDTFTVSPSNGVLPPANSEGALFSVSFSPVRYGLPQKGLLIVETKEMMWSYEVRGSHPTFVVPHVDAKVDTHLPRKYIRGLKPRSPTLSQL